MKVVTGETTYTWRRDEEAQDTWEQYEVRSASSEDMKLGLYSTSASKGSDDMFEDLALYVKNGYTIGAGTSGKDTSRTGGLNQDAKELGSALSVCDPRVLIVCAVQLSQDTHTVCWECLRWRDSG